MERVLGIAVLSFGELGANLFWAGGENRAKGAKDAKVKGMKVDAIGRFSSGVLLR